MIKSFKCKETFRIFSGEASRKFPYDIQKRALLKLRMIDASISIKDLENPPGNNLEKLKDDRKGQFSIRINDQWRICFKFNDSYATEVEICDYH